MGVTLWRMPRRWSMPCTPSSGEYHMLRTHHKFEFILKGKFILSIYVAESIASLIWCTIVAVCCSWQWRVTAGWSLMEGTPLWSKTVSNCVQSKTQCIAHRPLIAGCLKPCGHLLTAKWVKILYMQLVLNGKHWLCGGAWVTNGVVQRYIGAWVVEVGDNSMWQRASTVYQIWLIN